MALHEFELIQRYFSHIGPQTNTNVLLGIGDDAAIVSLSSDQELVFSIDTQLAGVHFPANAPPAWIAQRAFRCAVSDLAAMGAQATFFTLALSLPEADETWLQEFSNGLQQVATEFHCTLVGGDTTRGPLSITLQVHGKLAQGTALKRSTARAGDIILVSGFLGGAAAYIAMMQSKQLGDKNFAHAEQLFEHDYYFPTPCHFLGNSLRSYAHSAIDISDGLLADLQHICTATQLNAEINIDQLPLRPELLQLFDYERVLQLALSGGDDYQLCFTAPENKVRKILAIGEDLECPITVVGRVVHGAYNKEQPITCLKKNGDALDTKQFLTLGYRHF